MRKEIKALAQQISVQFKSKNITINPWQSLA